MALRIFSLVLWLFLTSTACDPNGQRISSDGRNGIQLSVGERERRGVEIGEELGPACEQGNRAACHRLSAWYSNGTYEANFIIHENREKAFHFTRLTCEFPTRESCRDLGRMYERGHGVERSLEKALAAYERACDTEVFRDACANVGRFHERGWGVENDYERAKSYYELSCTERFETGCAPLATLYLHGRGWPRDHEKARSLYEKVCSRDPHDSLSASGCAGLAVIYEKGLEVRPDRDKAISFYERSCRWTKNDRACSRLRELRDE